MYWGGRGGLTGEGAGDTDDDEFSRGGEGHCVVFCVLPEGFRGGGEGTAD